MHHSRFLLIPLILAGLTLSLGCETNTILRDQGRTALHHGDYDTAAERFERALERRTTDADALYYLGLTRLYQNQPREAQRTLERARNLRSEDSAWMPSILDAIAESFYQQERYDRLQAFVRDTARERGRTHDYLREAEYLVRIGDLDGARSAFLKAGLAEQRTAQPYLAMADFYASIQDREQAQQALRWAAHVQPNHPGIAHRMAGLNMTYGTEQPPSLNDIISRRQEFAADNGNF